MGDAVMGGLVTLPTDDRWTDPTDRLPQVSEPWLPLLWTGRSNPVVAKGGHVMPM